MAVVVINSRSEKPVRIAGLLFFIFVGVQFGDLRSVDFLEFAYGY
jgi:hypothetical protein